MLSTSILPTRVQADKCVQVRLVPGAGRAVFATRDFKAGDSILREKPLVALAPKSDKIHRFLSFAACSEEEQALILDMYTPGEIMARLTHVHSEAVGSRHTAH